ncbi:MAG: membrane protein insertion efficiency factor YidD [Puniceicoccales bacterium]|nr:membrane protein insertion efficiency factor YidD [Puniceicoccales bacterium]
MKILEYAAKLPGKIFRIISFSLIKFYQWFLSPAKIALLGPNARCRFSPNCSQFALLLLKKYSPAMALYYSFRRILRCHPHWRHGNRAANSIIPQKKS